MFSMYQLPILYSFWNDSFLNASWSVFSYPLYTYSRWHPVRMTPSTFEVKMSLAKISKGRCLTEHDNFANFCVLFQVMCYNYTVVFKNFDDFSLFWNILSLPYRLYHLHNIWLYCRYEYTKPCMINRFWGLKHLWLQVYWHAWFHLQRLRWPVQNGEGAKNSKWKYISPAGLEPTPRQSTTGKSAP